MRFAGRLKRSHIRSKTLRYVHVNGQERLTVVPLSDRLGTFDAVTHFNQERNRILVGIFHYSINWIGGKK
jgi:hypothetical protein